MVKLYCPKCQDVYVPKSSRYHHIGLFGCGFSFIYDPCYHINRFIYLLAPVQTNTNNSLGHIFMYFYSIFAIIYLVAYICYNIFGSIFSKYLLYIW